MNMDGRHENTRYLRHQQKRLHTTEVYEYKAPTSFQVSNVYQNVDNVPSGLSCSICLCPLTTQQQLDEKEQEETKAETGEGTNVDNDSNENYVDLIVINDDDDDDDDDAAAADVIVIDGKSESNKPSTSTSPPPTSPSVVKLNNCEHMFHSDCMSQAMNYSKNCPSCRKCLEEPQGNSPSGTMSIRYRTSFTLAGFENKSCGTIEIHYFIPSGIQQVYNESPGKSFSGAQRVAYLPDCQEGRALLKRFIYAFQHGLIFTIGTSLTSGKRNTVTWASVHHKTSRHGGPWGFPDESYFFNAHEELDNLNVPKY